MAVIAFRQNNISLQKYFDMEKAIIIHWKGVFSYKSLGKQQARTKSGDTEKKI